MGFTPEQVDRMTVWEFSSCLAGYNRAHGGGSSPQGEGMPVERMRDLGIDGL